MDERDDFATTLQAFMRRASRTDSDLARLTGISARTLEKWRSGEVRRPRHVADILKVARALALTPDDATTLLIAAGHLPLAALRQQAEQAQDAAGLALLDTWPSLTPANATAGMAGAVPLARHQVRVPIADFIGRTAEISRLTNALRLAGADGGVAVISGVQGMGGIGKTELAYVVAHRVRDAFPDAQIMLNLRGTSATPLTAEQTLQQIIRVFLPDTALPEELAALQARYQAVLHGLRVLILADDALAAAQLRPLIPPGGSALLITSRQRFTLPGMTIVDLEQLSPDEATGLLRAICPRLKTQEARMIAQACGYLPLALRISSSILRNTPALPVAVYLRRLSDECQRLTQLCDPDDPQLDVTASLALSYLQLDPPAQQVFCQLGVLVADFTMALALAVVDAPADVDVEAVLYQLLRRNLVMYDTVRERWQLHDLVRDLALGYLDSTGDREATMWRYARAAVQIAYAAQEQYLAGGDNVPAAIRRLATEHPHIDAARRWAGAQAETLEGARLLLDGAVAISTIGSIYYDLRQEYLPQLEAALVAAQRLHDRRSEGIILNSLGIIHRRLGDARRAGAYFEQALATCRAFNDRRGEARALGNLGNVYYALGDIRLSLTQYEQALEIFRAIANRRGEGSALNCLGHAYVVLADIPSALACFEQALDVVRAIGDRRTEGVILNNLGDSYARAGDHHRAVLYLEQRLTIAREIGDRHGEGVSLGNLGRTYAALSDTGRALEACERSLEILREIGDRRHEGYALSDLAHTYVFSGATGQAISTFDQALTLLQAAGDQRGAAECAWHYSLTLLHQGKSAAALPLLRSCVAYEQAIGHAHAAEHAALLARIEAGEQLPAEVLPAVGQYTALKIRRVPF